MFAKKERPDADLFDMNKLPYGKKAGDNKMGMTTCPFCTKPPTYLTKEQYRWGSAPPNEGFYLFRDELSAKEYYISGLCQDCQDEIFQPHPEDDES